MPKVDIHVPSSNPFEASVTLDGVPLPVTHLSFKIGARDVSETEVTVYLGDVDIRAVNATLMTNIGGKRAFILLEDEAEAAMAEMVDRMRKGGR
jgi:hypothetical protein